MIGIFEKIVWGLAALTLLGIALVVLFVGLPSTTPTIAMESKQLSPEELQAKLSAEQKKRFEAAKVSGDLDADGNLVPRSDGGRAAPQTIFEVNEPLLERLGSKNDCIAELQFAKSEILDDGSLKIFDIEDGSLLSKVGLKDNDILERVDGLKIDFRNTSEYIGSWQSSLENLRAGNPIVVEIKRKGARHHLVVAPGY